LIHQLLCCSSALGYTIQLIFTQVEEEIRAAVVT
jgi:hypothetical protein